MADVDPPVRNHEIENAEAEGSQDDSDEARNQDGTARQPADQLHLDQRVDVGGEGERSPDQQRAQREHRPVDQEPQGGTARLCLPEDLAQDHVYIVEQQQGGQRQTDHARAGQSGGVFQKLLVVLADVDATAGWEDGIGRLAQLLPRQIESGESGQDRQGNGKQGNQSQKRGVAETRRQTQPVIAEKSLKNETQEIVGNKART